jgi:hypothetical protein
MNLIGVSPIHFRRAGGRRRPSLALTLLAGVGSDLAPSVARPAFLSGCSLASLRRPVPRWGRWEDSRGRHFRSCAFQERNFAVKTNALASFGGSPLDGARHVCAFFNDDDEEYRVLLPFIKDGFECGDKAVHIVNLAQRVDHRRRMTAAGLDLETAEQDGRFELRTTTETYLRDGRFDPDRMLESFEQMASGGGDG